MNNRKSINTQFKLRADNGYFLMVSVEDHQYGVDMKDVVDIVGFPNLDKQSKITHSVNSNLELDGKAIEVIDLCARFGRGVSRGDETSSIIIVKSGEELTGILIDSTLGIKKIPTWIVNDSPSFVTQINNNCMKGIAAFEQDAYFIFTMNSMSILVRAD